MDGFIVINKPQNMTSYDIIRNLKKILPKKIKIGHLGTLDPMATGVLPIAIGQATKIIPYIEDKSKEYIATITLGGTSDTEDAWGEITYKDYPEVNEDQVRSVIESMVGEIEQVPPMYSAVHHEGQKLYELARKGIVVERKARVREVTHIKILNIDLTGKHPMAQFRVACSKGTYIRTLSKDIGEKLGTGGYLSGLIRTKSDGFNLSHSHNLADILNKSDIIADLLIAIDKPLMNWPFYEVKEENEYFSIINGNIIHTNSDLPEGNIRIYDKNATFIAIAEAYQNGSKIALKPIRVFKTV
ncbi:MAG TPA: tRNA pseudouridine(55) synthase TruB [Syntrophomonadaceae bacterium]|nr:tRNA pseudouridine(55) synthase TruB [Syntrophomonadaceae bacterium]